MATNTELVQQLYVAYFNRPADVDGLSYYVGVLEASADPVATAAAISADFANATEYKTAYAGMSDKQIINTIYHNIFGHEADIPGLNYWAGLYSTGAVTLANVVTAVAGGAQGTDKVAYDSKVAAATEFTSTIALSADQQIAYATKPEALAAGQAFLAGVTDATSLTAAVDNIDATTGALVPSVTSGLTIGADTIVGKTGNDVFNALTIGTDGKDATTLSAFDSIDGGAGNDTLNIYSDVGNTLNDFLATSVTVKNVETINIINLDTTDSFATGTSGSGVIDASKFVGATVISQTGEVASTVTNLAATTTAVFKNLKTASSLQVNAADAAKSATLSLSGFDDAGDLTVATAGAGKGVLNAVTVTGAVSDSAADGVDAIALDVTVGKDVQSVSVNTAVDVNLAVHKNGKVVTTVDASASAGAIAYVGDADAATIKTGAGADDVELNATLTATAKAASVSTGAGNDTILVDVTDGAVAGGTVSVDAGDGKDTINVTITTTAAYTVLAGAGDDKVVIDAGVVKTSDKIDGGAGTDSITLATGGNLVADDYIVFNKVLLNFETLKLTTVATNIDGSLLASNYTTLDLKGTSEITGVTATQALVANGALTATAAGYDNSGASTVYGGNLSINEKATGTVTTNASAVNLTVTGGSSASATGVDATLEGDFKTATVSLSAHTDTTVAATPVYVASTLTVDTADAAAVTSLTLSGNGQATITNAGKLTTVDASGLTSTDIDGELSGTALDYTSTSTKAETIKLGAGLDAVSIGSSLYGGPDAGHTFDTIQGLTLVLDAGGAIDAAKSDTLVITTAAGTIEKFTTTKTDIDLALKDATAYAKAHTVTDVVFQVGGNTYFVHDAGTLGSIDAADTVVKLVGNINLDALILAL
jgi:hypothetical protein